MSRQTKFEVVTIVDPMVGWFNRQLKMGSNPKPFTLAVARPTTANLAN